MHDEVVVWICHHEGYREVLFGSKRAFPLSEPRGGDSHMKQTGMLVGNFEFNP